MKNILSTVFFFLVCIGLFQYCSYFKIGGFGGGSSSATDSTQQNSYATYQEACKAGDFDAAYTLIDKMKQLNANESEISKAEDFVWNSEMRYLAAQNTKEASDRIIFLLNEIDEEGTPLSEGVYSYYDFSSEERKSYGAYRNWVRKFNLKCNKIMDLAINQSNEYLAKKLIKLYKQNCKDYTNSDISNSVTKEFNGKMVKLEPRFDNSVYVYRTWEDRDAAQKRYNEAVADGTFSKKNDDK